MDCASHDVRLMGTGIRSIGMNAPIDRTRQIELMTTAKERHAKRIAEWHSDPVIRGALLDPTKVHVGKSAYKAVRKRTA